MNGFNQQVRTLVQVLRIVGLAIGVWGVIAVGWIVNDYGDTEGSETTDTVALALNLGAPVLILAALLLIASWVIDLLGELASHARGDEDDA